MRQFFSVHFPCPKSLLWKDCEKLTVIKLQKGLMWQVSGGQLPTAPAIGVPWWGKINTLKNNWKLNAFLWPSLMAPAGCAQKITLPFHLSYLLIFLKSVSDNCFLGCSYKRKLGCRTRVRWNYWNPETFFCCFSLLKDVANGKRHSVVQ